MLRFTDVGYIYFYINDASITECVLCKIYFAWHIRGGAICCCVLGTLKYEQLNGMCTVCSVVQSKQFVRTVCILHRVDIGSQKRRRNYKLQPRIVDTGTKSKQTE